MAQRLSIRCYAPEVAPKEIYNPSLGGFEGPSSYPDDFKFDDFIQSPPASPSPPPITDGPDAGSPISDGLSPQTGPNSNVDPAIIEESHRSQKPDSSLGTGPLQDISVSKDEEYTFNSPEVPTPMVPESPQEVLTDPEEEASASTYPCTICLEPFNSQRSLDDHAWHEHSFKAHFCSNSGCSKSFARLDNQRTHTIKTCAHSINRKMCAAPMTALDLGKKIERQARRRKHRRRITMSIAASRLTSMPLQSQSITRSSSSPSGPQEATDVDMIGSNTPLLMSPNEVATPPVQPMIPDSQPFNGAIGFTQADETVRIISQLRAQIKAQKANEIRLLQELSDVRQVCFGFWKEKLGAEQETIDLKMALQQRDNELEAWGRGHVTSAPNPWGPS
ncbi:hypothetical protein TWF506_004061 [Arthrobotrys conoides]|uniref:C2H2-type domain-containing protein n=1 Tax=Arthrobotrys conoides TaxID=74498 RepID=A0AAN8RIY8_9PEZI